MPSRVLDKTCVRRGQAAPFSSPSGGPKDHERLRGNDRVGFVFRLAIQSSIGGTGKLVCPWNPEGADAAETTPSNKLGGVTRLPEYLHTHKEKVLHGIMGIIGTIGTACTKRSYRVSLSRCGLRLERERGVRLRDWALLGGVQRPSRLLAQSGKCPPQCGRLRRCPFLPSDRRPRNSVKNQRKEAWRQTNEMQGRCALVASCPAIHKMATPTSDLLAALSIGVPSWFPVETA